MSTTYLKPGTPIPVPQADGLDKPYWDGLREEKLLVQKCNSCGKHQWAPEWICHHCLSFDVGYTEIAPEAVLYSWERNWHPPHPALKDQGPYLVILVELPHADNIRMYGNLLGDPMQEVKIGSKLTGVFEHHNDAEIPFSLLQWKLA